MGRERECRLKSGDAVVLRGRGPAGNHTKKQGVVRVVVVVRPVNPVCMDVGRGVVGGLWC